MKTGLSLTKTVLKYWGKKKERRQLFCCSIFISSPPSPMPTSSFVTPLAWLNFTANCRICYIQVFAIGKGDLVLCVYIYGTKKLTINNFCIIHICVRISAHT